MIRFLFVSKGVVKYAFLFTLFLLKKEKTQVPLGEI